MKIGNLDISAFKVGSSDCKIYLGDTLLYSGGTTPTSPKLIAYLSGGTTESISYDGSNCLTSGETRNVNDRGYVTSATVSDYITCIDENTFGGRTATYTAFRYIEEITFLSTTPPTCTYEYFSHPFHNLSYLTKIYVPAESVDAYKAEWSGCSSLIQAIPTPPSYNYITYNASAKLAETTSMYSPGLHTNAFSGASGQLTMTSHTFENGVGTVEFDDDVISIGDYAFYHCDSLTSIDIPDSVTSIGDDAFAFCSSLTSIDIPDSVTSIGDGMIDGSGIQTITIGSGITYIDSCGLCCNDLTNGVTIKAVNPPTIPNCNWIFAVQSLIYVPAESVTAYQNDQCWSAYAQGIVPIT